MIELTQPAEAELLQPFDVIRAHERSDEELDAQPFGIIGLDSKGRILRYNVAEARMARLDRNQVLEKNFFREVAPCTQTPEFEGRFRDFVRPGNAVPTQRFGYTFDFQFGAQEVEVEMVRSPVADRFYLCINRRKFLPPRSAARRPAPLQEELAPDEARQGVVRDGTQRRHVQVTPLFFEAMRATWDRVAPKGWPIFCAEWGLKWGRLAVVDLETDALEETGQTLRELPMKLVVGFLAQYLQGQGWGKVAADFTPSQQGAFVVSISRGALAESIGFSEVTRCHLFAGFFRAFFCHLANKLLSVREVCCQAQGHARCQFIVAGQSRGEALEKAVRAADGDVGAALELLREAPDGRA